ncbi:MULTISPECIES: flagellar basal body L-ring protein FlgH [Corallincola]|uniref:Flagellar L-ring protein n=3 Tax=Corallincola TaxID=1775176 RepID=A0A368N4V8_9GAMM|nr:MULTISPECIES: flagellar basal body L-ring protein FlgH [Corallincola]RCU44591.1 flagellar basal body L-ring protein FlgH [Corallincola holothuriorum]TAA40336.1 flagellar basal body L-ring protein FlgH [Corallincola spongiicola]TCI05357.1 flagellar basal body L-ring protein FlgH [Corallincola luteus]
MKKLIPLSALLLSACSSVYQVQPDDPYYAPLIPEMPEEGNMVLTGSMFQDVTAQNLYSDIKARRVGDVITVNLVENTTANKGAKNELDKSSSVGLQTPVLMGSPFTINGNELNASIEGDNEFEGESKVRQNNSLFGAISVSVVQVLSNGHLVVRGEKWITINQGDEYIRLTGIIRPEDVTGDNNVDSTRVANARIQYSGTGSTHDTQTPGWLTGFFNSPIWPF